MSLSPASVAAADPGAEATPVVSQTTPEASPESLAPDRTAEGLSPETPGGETPSLESGAPGDAPKDKEPPWHHDPRFQKMRTEAEATRTELEALRPQFEQAKPLVEALEHHGFYEVEHLDSAVQAAHAFQHIDRLMSEEPIAFAQDMQRVHPEAYQAMSSAIVQASFAERARAYRTAGDNDRAAIFEEEARAYGQQPQGSLGRNPTLAREREALTREREQLNSERRADFETKIDKEIGSRLNREIDRLVAGIKFPNPEAKEDFFEGIARRLDEMAEGDRAFQQEIERLMSPQGGYGQRQLDSIVGRYVSRALHGGTLEKMIADKLRVWSLSLQAGEQQRKDTLNQAAKDIVGGGAPSNGQLQGAALDSHVQKLRKSGRSFRDVARAIVNFGGS